MRWPEESGTYLNELLNASSGIGRRERGDAGHGRRELVQGVPIIPLSSALWRSAFDCPLENVPKELISGPRWICLKLQGPFPFSQTGVLLSFIEPLSRNGIPIFAVSTYDTDYVLVPEEFAEAALAVLQSAGHERI